MAHHIAFSILLLLSFSTIATQQLQAQTAEEVFSAVRGLIQQGQGIKTEFQSRTYPDIKGTLAIGKANMFKMELGQKSIICDGKTIYNYDSQAQKVIISDYIDGGDVLAPERFFTSFPQQYIPSLKRVQGSKGSSYLLLTLVPERAEEKVGNLEKVVLKLQPLSYEVRELTISDGSIEETWILTNFSAKAALPKSEFTFQPPKQARVIDLR